MTVETIKQLVEWLDADLGAHPWRFDGEIDEAYRNRLQATKDAVCAPRIPPPAFEGETTAELMVRYRAIRAEYYERLKQERQAKG